MNFFDIIILIILGGFVLAGFWFGFIHMVGSLVGLVGGALVAGWYHEPVAKIAAPWLGNNLNLARLLAFFFIFVLFNRLVGVIVYLADKTFKFISVIPFLKTFNRLLGAGLSLIEGTFVLALGVYFAAKFPAGAAFEMALRDSQLARSLNAVGSALAPLLPKAVQMVQSVL